ncbi:hypothetical protein [Rhodopirellula bahusiensis]|uniref:Uncharacterized protein n=1 Tax=Rhodopirellula bahusiensis TaxID=2014065 RepID=A0A2G1W805_9BACT|nr:hypothetical protein [Rhodopirellula bahusiensis]PHQ35175.1 hypothetical protein CEE69_12250 [Rhodopirellula bahusiensis]
MIDNTNDDTLGESNDDRKAAIAKLERQAASDAGLNQSSRTTRKAVASIRRQLPRRSQLRSLTSKVSRLSRPSRYERTLQRRALNETRIERLSDSDIAAIPPAEVPSEEAAIEKHRRALPAFYHQQHGGRTQAELLEMRDFRRDQIPSQFTVKEWRSLVRQQLHDWAESATKPESLAGEPRQQPAPMAQTPTEQAARVVEAASVDVQQPSNDGTNADPVKIDPESFVTLATQDHRLLNARRGEVEHDPELLRRFDSIHNQQQHPDSGEPIDLEAEVAKASKSVAQEQARSVMDGTPGDMNTEHPSRSETTVDMLQIGADALGIVDQTAITDSANAMVSLARAAMDPRRRKEHLRNAAVSFISTAPVVGDFAKVFKASSMKRTFQSAAFHESEKKPSSQRAPRRRENGRDDRVQSSNEHDFDVKPWMGDSINDFLDVAKLGKPQDIPKGRSPSLAQLRQRSSSGADAARTFVEHHGGFSGETGKTDVLKVAEAMEAMKRQQDAMPPVETRPESRGQQPGDLDPNATDTSSVSNAVDLGQLALDGIGIADPTPISDGLNTAISIGRAVTDPNRRGEHLQNAAISAVSMIPFVGDLAKVFKAPRATRSVNQATRAMKRQPAGKAANRLDGIVDAQRVDDIAEGSSMANRTTAGDTAGGSGGGDVPPISPSITDPGDPDRDPRETKRRIEDQRKLQELQDSYLDTLEDVVLATGAFGVALLGAVKAVGVVIAANKSTISNNKHLEELNPVIAGAFVRHELDEVRRNLRRGEALQDQVANAIEADSEYETMRAKFTTPIDSMKADFGTAGTEVTSTMAEFGDAMTGLSRNLNILSQAVSFSSTLFSGLNDIAKSGLDLFSGKPIAEWMTGKKDEPKVNPNATPAQKFLDDIRDGKFDGRSDVPPFFTRKF